MPPLPINSLCKDRRSFWKSTVLSLERKASFEVHVDSMVKSYEEGSQSWNDILGASTIEDRGLLQVPGQSSP